MSGLSMKTTRLTFKTTLSILFVAFAALMRVPAAPPQAQGGLEHFSKDGLSFDYPVGWTLTDSSNGQLQSLLLRREGVSTVITVFAQREPFETQAKLIESRGAVTA